MNQRFTEEPELLIQFIIGTSVASLINCIKVLTETILSLLDFILIEILYF